MTSQALPVHLISGLLGSGKTSCLIDLIKQKPLNEQWLIIINEFGDIDIDKAQISSFDDNNIYSAAVAGGCICCSAQLNLQQALIEQLQQHQHKIDRIFIEPTGLGHPAKIIDTLQKTPWPCELVLGRSVCLTNAEQLTEQNWQKSAVLRDLITLADIIVINKTDLAVEDDIKHCATFIGQLYPGKPTLIKSQFGKLDLAVICEKKTPQPLQILAAKDEHTKSLQQLKRSGFDSLISNTEQCFVQTDTANNLFSIGWQWTNKNQFNRVALKQFFANYAAHLLRAKGLIKTGNEWQLLNLSDGVLQFDDIAWRADSRLQLIFNSESENPINLRTLENDLQACLYKCD